MQINFTQFGAVGVDTNLELPRTNPDSAARPNPTGEAFARSLDRAAAQIEGEAASHAEPREDDSVALADSEPEQEPGDRIEDAPADREAAESQSDDQDDSSSSQDSESTDASSTDREPPLDRSTASLRRSSAQEGAHDPAVAERGERRTNTETEGSASRTRQGKGAGPSVSIFSAETEGAADQPALTASSSSGASNIDPSTTPLSSASQTNAVSAIGDGVVHAPGAASTHSALDGAARSAEGPVDSYASLDPRRMQLASEARDSIFRQIAMRMTPGGGEMRVFVDPPELGELEMRLRVEGDAMKLAVIAERPEVAVTLQKHLPELRQQLAAQGIEVTDADISARDDSDRAHREQPENKRDRATQREGEQLAASLESKTEQRGYIRADGFDIWI